MWPSRCSFHPDRVLPCTECRREARGGCGLVVALALLLALTVLLANLAAH
jgi:hypothetical protein